MTDEGVSKEDQQLATVTSVITEEKVKPSKGMVSRIWSAMGLVGHLFFRNTKEDFEKRLQHLSKEEVAAHSRLKKRTQFWRKFARNLILYSVISEVLVLGIAIYSTRNQEMSWETRSWRVLPVFALPILTTIVYSSCSRYYRMREGKDQKTLERLRAERQAKIDELKETTNYYRTQQLIQKYDLDPTAKAAAASALASKLGAESGLKFALQAVDLLEKEGMVKSPKPTRSNDMEGANSSGMRKRRTLSRKASKADGRSSIGQSSEFQGGSIERIEGSGRRVERGETDMDAWEHQREVEHHRERPNEGGWIARFAAMLVGEDPTQCYALICGKCHMHNGLAKKEDYQYITYYCPHCHALNKSNQLGESETSEQSGGRGPTPRNPGAGFEEVFSTSGGSLTALQDSSLSSSPLVEVKEPKEEFEDLSS